jgi:methylated-DNA-[protein]-cysteine S-methyltransferase
VPLDIGSLSGFAQRVSTCLRRVPPGKVITYGELARRSGRPQAARAIGRILAANPVPLLIPCHRVVAADGKPGGFSAAGGVVTKARILFAEGVSLNPVHAEGLATLRRADPVLKKIISQIGPYLPGLQDPGNPYERLLLAIMSQQLAAKAASTIAARVRQLTPGPDFPTARQLVRISDGRLRKAGLSKQKVSYLRDLAANLCDDRLDLRRLSRLKDEAVIQALTRVRGIGRWTAEVFLIFQLGRLDVLPLEDISLRNAITRAYGLAKAPDREKLREMGKRWQPYRSMASWYLWHSTGIDL